MRSDVYGEAKIADSFTTDALRAINAGNYKLASVLAQCAQAHATIALAMATMEGE